MGLAKKQHVRYMPNNTRVGENERESGTAGDTSRWLYESLNKLAAKWVLCMLCAVEIARGQYDCVLLK